MTDELSPSIRGLTEGISRTPLIEIKGKLDDYNSEKTPFNTMNVNLQFVDIEVIQSSEPYPFPIAQIPIKYSNRVSSGWGIFSKSLDKLIPESEDLKDQKGKRMHLRKRSHTFGKDRDTGDDMIGDVWEVQEIEGSSAPKVNPTTKALQLLDGKTEAEFNQVVFTDATIKTSQETLQAVIAKTFIPAQIADGKVTKDPDGVYHLVK